MTDFTGTRYVKVDSEQAGTPEYVAWLEQRVEGLEKAAIDAILILGGFDPAKVAEDMGAVADKAMMDVQKEALAAEEEAA